MGALSRTYLSDPGRVTPTKGYVITGPPLCSTGGLDEQKIVVLEPETSVFALGESAYSENVNDFVPSSCVAGDGAVAAFQEGMARVFALGIAVVSPLIEYVSGTTLDDSLVQATSYTGTDIAKSEGKGPYVSAVQGDYADVGQFSAEADPDVACVVGPDFMAPATARECLENLISCEYVLGFAVAKEFAARSLEQTSAAGIAATK